MKESEKEKRAKDELNGQGGKGSGASDIRLVLTDS